MFEWFIREIGRGSAEAVFFTIFFAGISFSVVSTLFSGHGDTDHDTGHDGDHGDNHGDGGHQVSLSSFLSVRGISLFVTGFGGVGYLVMHYRGGILLASVSGVLGGFGVALIGVWLIHIAMKQQANSALKSGDIVGKEAVVTIAIPKSQMGRGEVSIQGVHLYKPAVSADVQGINEGTAVRVVRAVGDFVVVERVQA